MRKRVQTTIEQNDLKNLDMKIVQSDFFKDRSSYFEFLIKFLPYIPDNIRPDADTNMLIKTMYEKSLTGTGADGAASGNGHGLTETDMEIINMAKNFSLKTKTGGTSG